MHGNWGPLQNVLPVLVVECCSRLERSLSCDMVPSVPSRARTIGDTVSLGIAPKHGTLTLTLTRSLQPRRVAC